MITDKSRECLFSKAKIKRVASIRSPSAINLRTFLSFWRMPFHWLLKLMYRTNSKHIACVPRFHFRISLSFLALLSTSYQDALVWNGKMKGPGRYNKERRINVFVPKVYLPCVKCRLHVTCVKNLKFQSAFIHLNSLQLNRMYGISN